MPEITGHRDHMGRMAGRKTRGSGLYGGTRRRDNLKGAYTVKHETAPAPAIIAKLTNEQLLKAWETTESLSTSPETAITRGWIMDELEKRNPSAFNAWLDSESPEDSTLRRYFTEN